CQRNHDGHDPRTGEVTQKNEEDGDDQAHAHQQIVHNVMCRHMDELGAPVEDPDSHPGRKELPLLDLYNLLLHAPGDVQRLLVLPHEYDALDHVVFRFPAFIPADDSEARLMPFDNLGDVTYEDGIALVLGDDDVADVLELLFDDLGS